MRLLEELFGDLAKVVDEADGSVALERVLDGEDVHVALVEEVVEHIGRLHCRLARLPTAVYMYVLLQ
jgi:hypothetical protein